MKLIITFEMYKCTMQFKLLHATIKLYTCMLFKHKHFSIIIVALITLFLHFKFVLILNILLQTIKYQYMNFKQI